ncbi:hypothetical protein ACI2LC_44920 [Nonomuraea wenchangensis]|uniref:hypothetical protein n=1 Tax=Nonomuraea wenchangensis TaxID=568860 RepID=UPI0038513422
MEADLIAAVNAHDRTQEQQTDTAPNVSGSQGSTSRRVLPASDPGARRGGR